MGERPIEAPTAPLTSPPVIKLDEELPEAWEAAWRLHCALQPEQREKFDAEWLADHEPWLVGILTDPR
jgi:hypothetical protein